MKENTGRTAITIDGIDEPVRGGRVDFAVGSVPLPRRPLTGLAIAVVTAVVTMGAMGPAAAESQEGVSALACASPEVAITVDSPRTTSEADQTRAATRVPWWLLPHLARWVDPATGMTMQAQANRAPPVMDHRVRDR